MRFTRVWDAVSIRQISSDKGDTLKTVTACNKRMYELQIILNFTSLFKANGRIYTLEFN
jgi:hypothetical protein